MYCRHGEKGVYRLKTVNMQNFMENSWKNALMANSMLEYRFNEQVSIVQM